MSVYRTIGPLVVLMKLCENSVLFSKTKARVSTLFFYIYIKKRSLLVCIAILIFLHGVLLGAAVCIFSEFWD